MASDLCRECGSVPVPMAGMTCYSCLRKRERRERKNQEHGRPQKMWWIEDWATGRKAK